MRFDLLFFSACNGVMQTARKRVVCTFAFTRSHETCSPDNNWVRSFVYIIHTERARERQTDR